MTTAVLERPVTTSIQPTISPLRSKPLNAVKQRMQARIDPIYDTLLAPIQHHYQIYDEPKVLAFLRNHSQLIPILQEGPAVVAEIFGDDTPST